MSKSALSKSANLPAELFENQHPESPAREAGTPAWKHEVNQRLAAHRNRRGGPQDAGDAQAQQGTRIASGRAAEAAARVAARYAKAPSYNELLAGEARAVVRAAGAAAEAARNAQAAAQAVLAGLESGPIASGSWEPAPQSAVQEVSHSAPPRWQDEAPTAEYEPVYEAPREALRETHRESLPRAGAQPRWEETLPVPAAGRDLWSEMRVSPAPAPAYRPSKDYGQGYGYGHETDEGELFPYDAVGHATVEPVQHLPANLIEFPRELVATRKARPRLAEGPFYDASHENSQLSIFEVDPATLDAQVTVSDTPAATVAPPEWASIELDHHPEPEFVERVHYGRAFAPAVEVAGMAVEAMPFAAPAVHREVNERGVDGALRVKANNAEAGRKPSQEKAESYATPAVELLVAPMSDRLLAGVVDGALVTLAFLAAAVVVIASTEHPPTGRIALAAAGVGLLLFGMLYQFLFLSYAEEGTPGMRYARIALCTFDDDNPSREQMQMRIPALALSALPAGLGMIWALLDKEKLGWHDRWTRTYQRKY